MSLFFNQVDYILFLQGISYLFLAVACLIIRKGEKISLAWYLLGLSGALHCTGVLMGLLEFSLGANPILNITRLYVIAVSYIFMAEFGRMGVNSIRASGPGRWIMLPIVLLAVLMVALGGEALGPVDF